MKSICDIEEELLLQDAPEPSPEAPEDTLAQGPILTVDKGTLSPLRPENSGSESFALSMHDADTALSPLSSLVEAAKDFATDAKAGATKKAYRGDWERFTAWCQENGAVALPALPEVIGAYVAHLAQIGKKAATIERALVSISQAHKLAGQVPSPTASAAVQETLKGVRRSLGVAQRQVSPLVVEHLRRLVTELPSSLIGLRDRAVLLVGFASALRRSELVSLAVADLEDVPEGLVILLRKSKTDQESAGRRIGVPFGAQPETCPVRALRAWLEAAAISEGPLFRAVDRHGRIGTTALSDKAVAEVVKRAMAGAGYDAKAFSGHSLRAGFVTAAAAAGKSERAIMNQTGHRSERMVRKYIRDGQLFVGNAADPNDVFSDPQFHLLAFGNSSVSSLEEWDRLREAIREAEKVGLIVLDASPINEADHAFWERLRSLARETHAQVIVTTTFSKRQGSRSSKFAHGSSAIDALLVIGRTGRHGRLTCRVHPDGRETSSHDFDITLSVENGAAVLTSVECHRSVADRDDGDLADAIRSFGKSASLIVVDPLLREEMPR